MVRTLTSSATTRQMRFDAVLARRASEGRLHKAFTCVPRLRVGQVLRLALGEIGKMCLSCCTRIRCDTSERIHEQSGLVLLRKVEIILRTRNGYGQALSEQTRSFRTDTKEHP